MEIFICDNNELKLTLEKLYAKVIANGGWLNPEIIIHESKGELSVRSKLEPAVNEPLIRIPEECLPTINDFDFYIENDQLDIRASHSNVNDLHVCLVELMIDIFNQTRKISWHRKTSPWFAISKSPRLLDKLCEGREGALKISKYYALYQSGDYDQLLIDTFLGSRTLNFKLSGSKSAKPRLLPFIDYINHHRQCSGFKTMKKEDHSGKELVVVNSKPLTGSAECFVSYNKAYDALDTYMIYGFTDLSAPYMRSIPVKIILSNGIIINVHSNITRGYKRKLPETLTNLRFYIPNPIKNEEGYGISSLVIPGEKSPRALRKVLRYVISSLLPGADPESLRRDVLSAEQTILEKNIGYYKELHSILDSTEEGMLTLQAVDNLNILVTKQLHKLNGYKERMSLIF